MTNATTPPPGAGKRWLPNGWRKRLIVGAAALLAAVLVAAVPVVLPRILDQAGQPAHQPTDPSAPFLAKTQTIGYAPTHAYAISTQDLTSSPRTNALITAGSRPETATPIGIRTDSWVLRASGTDPVTIVDITAVAMTVDDPDDEVYVEYGQGGQGGGDDPSEIVNLAVDLTSGDALTAAGARYFDGDKVVLHGDRSTYLSLSFTAPQAQSYTWTLHFDVETSDGTLLDIYAGPSGQLYTDKALVPPTDRFRVTGRADSYETSYLPGANGRPELSTSALSPAASSDQPSAAVPEEIAGRWCARVGDAGCLDFASFMREHPQATFSASPGGDAGTTSYSVCLNGPGDCVTATMMYLEYFPPGATWNCAATNTNDLWDGCSPDYTADHDPAQPRLVVRPNHQQGEQFVDTPPLYRAER